MAADCKSAEVTLRRFESAPLHLVFAMKFSDIAENHLYWLAGILEGEGSFIRPTPSAPNRPIISMQSTNEDVIAKVASLLGVSYYRTPTERYDRNGWKHVYSVRLRGARGVQLMQLLKPLMGQRRQQQIAQAIENYKPVSTLISEGKAKELAQRYWKGERHPTALGREYGISKNLAIHYIKKYADMAQW